MNGVDYQYYHLASVRKRLLLTVAMGLQATLPALSASSLCNSMKCQPLTYWIYFCSREKNYVYHFRTDIIWWTTIPGKRLNLASKLMENGRIRIHYNFFLAVSTCVGANCYENIEYKKFLSVLIFLAVYLLFKKNPRQKVGKNFVAIYSSPL